MAKTFRLFVSPRGFANEGTIYGFANPTARDAALRIVAECIGDDVNSRYYRLTAAEAASKLCGDAATRSYVGEATADDFAEYYHGKAGTVFPAIRPNGTTVDVRLEGDAYGLHTSGTGDMIVTRPLPEAWTSLTDRPIGTLRVNQHDERGGIDAGLADNYWFGEDAPGGVARMMVGAPRGEDEERAAYEWWPVYLDGALVAELRDDAHGYALHVNLREAEG